MDANSSVHMSEVIGAFNMNGAGGFNAAAGSLTDVYLTIANNLINQGYFNIAIVTSHIACEIAAERAFDAAYAAKNLETLGAAVDDLMNGNNLGNERHRKLYNALTGTNIEKESFWQQFKTASKLRNAIIHKGSQANKDEAEAALQAAKDLIAYLKQLGRSDPVTQGKIEAASRLV